MNDLNTQLMVLTILAYVFLAAGVVLIAVALKNFIKNRIWTGVGTKSVPIKKPAKEKAETGKDPEGEPVDDPDGTMDTELLTDLEDTVALCEETSILEEKHAGFVVKKETILKN